MIIPNPNPEDPLRDAPFQIEPNILAMIKELADAPVVEATDDPNKWRCGHKLLTADEHRRVLVCRGRGRVLDPFDWIVSRAQDTAAWMSRAKHASGEALRLQEEARNINESVKRLRQRARLEINKDHDRALITLVELALSITRWDSSVQIGLLSSQQARLAAKKIAAAYEATKDHHLALQASGFLGAPNPDSEG